MFMHRSSGGTRVPPPLPRDFQRWCPWTPHLLSLTRGQHEVRFLRFFLLAFARHSYTREPSIKILQSWSNWLVDYICNVLLENTSLIWTRHHCRWRAVKLGLWLLSREGDLNHLYHATPALTQNLGLIFIDIPMCVLRGDWMGRSLHCKNNV